MKVKLVGKLGTCIEREGCTLTMMKHQGRMPELPTGVPVPEPIPITHYVVYIATPQWRVIREAVKDPDDVAIIEGVQFYDSEHGAIAVFATSCTTRFLEHRRQEEEAVYRAIRV